MSGDGSMSKEFENLQRETPVGEHGPRSAREHNTDSIGAEGKEPVGAEEVAGMGDGERKGDYLRRGEKGGGLVDKK